jgi:integrase
MKLKPADVRSLGDGMHNDGNYLWLRVRGASRSWIVRGPRDSRGRRPEAGLGSVDRVSLSLARKERDKLVEQWANGKDPIAERRAAKEKANRQTFADVAALKIEAKRSGWRTSFEGRTSTLDSWTRDMERCAPIAKRAVEEITVDEVKRVVSPYWDRGHWKAARDLLKRIEAVFNYAIAHGWRSAANPAAWAVFRELWPGETAAKTPRAALPWRDAPAFLSALRSSEAVGARIVEFAILTATRSGEARGAKWAEIDFAARVWTVPAERMKKGGEHAVPLSGQAIDLLRRMEAERVGEHVFPGVRLVPNASRTRWRSREERVDEPMPNSSVWKLVKRLGGDVTTHGFRSTFRDWCGDHGIDRELAERSLAHRFGSAVESAYARSRLVARRAPVMQAWADFLDGKASNVIPLRPAA